ncbi:hypothetical protein UPYG_G00186110 [Umbra pygmaea]|uniref:Tankyrase 1-binding protein C-terminal domain-containing protein n=1 Tax=Umbra pygmaea TaxID=75934 RepID=A0ABD0WRS3_UMBPY
MFFVNFTSEPGLHYGRLTDCQVFFTGMATQVEMQTGEVGRTGVGGRLRLGPLSDSSNKSLPEGLSNSQGSLIITPEPSKPVPGPKPRLTPKPFVVEKNPTIRPIVAPKPNTKPQPEPAHRTSLKPNPASALKPHQPNVASRHRPVSNTPSRPSPTSYKPSLKLSTGETTKPVAPPFKPAPPVTLGDPSKPTVTHSQSPKKPPSAEWSGSTKQDKEWGKTASKCIAGGTCMTRAKSMGSLGHIGLEEEKGVEEPDVKVQLRGPVRGSRNRPVSAIFLPSTNQAEASSPAARYRARRPLSADLTSKFESIGLSLHRGRPATTDSKENSPEEVAQVRRKERGMEGTPLGPDSKPSVLPPGSKKKMEEQKEDENEKGKSGESIKRRISILLDSSSPLSPSKPDSKEGSPEEVAPLRRRERGMEGTLVGFDSKPLVLPPGSEKKTEEKKEDEDEDGKSGGSIKRRISILLDSSSPLSPVVPLHVTAQETELRSPVQPGPEANLPSGGVKQRVKKITEEFVTPPAQTPAVKAQFKPRPLPPDLTKRFDSERSTDLGTPSPKEATGRNESDTDPQRREEDSIFNFSDQKKVDEDTRGTQGQPTRTSSDPTARWAIADKEMEAQEKHSSIAVQTVRAALFENVVERHSVLVMEDDRTPKVSKGCPKRCVSLKLGDEGKDDSLVTTTYRSPVSPPSPLRVEHSFDTVHVVGQRRAVSESVPSAQLENKAMTLRSRRSQGNRVEPPQESLALAQQERPASQQDQGPRYLRIGALPKWNTGLMDREAEMEREHQKETGEQRQMEKEEDMERRKMMEIQETVFDGDEQRGDMDVPFDDFSRNARYWSSQMKVLQVRRNPSLEEALTKRLHDEESMQELMEKTQSQRRDRGMSGNRQKWMEDMEKEDRDVRDVKRESENLETDKQRQQDMERQKQRKLERHRGNEQEEEIKFEKQQDFEKQQQQREFEKQQREFEKQQAAKFESWQQQR